MYNVPQQQHSGSNSTLSLEQWSFPLQLRVELNPSAFPTFHTSLASCLRVWYMWCQGQIAQSLASRLEFALDQPEFGLEEPPRKIGADTWLTFPLFTTLIAATFGLLPFFDVLPALNTAARAVAMLLLASC